MRNFMVKQIENSSQYDDKSGNLSDEQKEHEQL